jgi:ferritin
VVTLAICLSAPFVFRELHAVASSVDDAEMEQFVEAMLQEQAADVQRAAELVSRARRYVGVVGVGCVCRF